MNDLYVSVYAISTTSMTPNEINLIVSDEWGCGRRWLWRSWRLSSGKM